MGNSNFKKVNSFYTDCLIFLRNHYRGVKNLLRLFNENIKKLRFLDLDDFRDIKYED